MDKRLQAWAGWFFFLFAVDFAAPFLLFRNTPTLAGSFLFWIVWALAAMASMFAIFMRWHEPTGLKGDKGHE